MFIWFWVFALNNTYMMLCTTKANSSLKRFSNHAGIPSAPVAFLGLRCLSVDLTCPTDGNLEVEHLSEGVKQSARL